MFRDKDGCILMDILVVFTVLYSDSMLALYPHART